MRLENVLKQVRTPNKISRLILSASYKKGAFDSHLVDCPFVFHHEGRFYMTYIGWDSIGYRTGLASSDDLIHWRKEGMIIDRGLKGSPTEFNVALTWILRDNDLFGEGCLKKVDGFFIGTYHAYPKPGYEAGSAAIGLAYSKDLRHWDLDEPVLFCSDGGGWEKGGLYKSCLLEHEGVYYMFYNAKNNLEWPWVEQTGLATSSDLKKWKRFEKNPVLTIGRRGSFDDVFASDPCVLKCGDLWAMFYYGLSSDGHARNSVAFSRNLLQWEKSGEVLIDVGPKGAVDELHAHKPSLIFWNGKLYHFYCAVTPAANRRIGEIEYHEVRGITVATS
ncbi:MAG: hypothetical protein N3F08_01620 [Crenarchaeota archaeon]|nr:hypothetical protein [Thermoproteota archaeon]